MCADDPDLCAQMVLVVRADDPDLRALGDCGPEMIQETGSSGDGTVSIMLDSGADISVLPISHGYANVGECNPNTKVKMIDAQGEENFLCRHHEGQTHGDEFRWQKG